MPLEIEEGLFFSAKEEINPDKDGVGSDDEGEKKRGGGEKKMPNTQKTTYTIKAYSWETEAAARNRVDGWLDKVFGWYLESKKHEVDNRRFVVKHLLCFFYPFFPKSGFCTRAILLDRATRSKNRGK